MGDQLAEGWHLVPLDRSQLAPETLGLAVRGATMTQAMPTLCRNAGALPESYRQHLNADGVLQIGDAFGMEAQWIISQVTFCDEHYFEEMDWTREQIESDERGAGCVRCGDFEAETVRSVCEECR